MGLVIGLPLAPKGSLGVDTSKLRGAVFRMVPEHVPGGAFDNANEWFIVNGVGSIENCVLTLGPGVGSQAVANLKRMLIPGATYRVQWETVSNPSSDDVALAVGDFDQILSEHAGIGTFTDTFVAGDSWASVTIANQTGVGAVVFDNVSIIGPLP